MLLVQFQIIFDIDLSADYCIYYKLINMSNYEEYKQNLSPEQLERFEAKIASDREQYAKVTELAASVSADPTSRLPYIPAFYRIKKPEDQQIYLNQIIPKIHEARGEEFCLETCHNQGPSCLSECKSFARQAFSLGLSIFAGYHKPYTYNSFVNAEQE